MSSTVKALPEEREPTVTVEPLTLTVTVPAVEARVALGVVTLLPAARDTLPPVRVALFEAVVTVSALFEAVKGLPLMV